MAAAALFLAETNGCVATLNYDDVLLIASTIRVDNTAGDTPVTFYVNTSGVKQSATVQPGNSQLVAFPAARSVTLNGVKLTITGLTFFGIGTGAGIGT